MDFRLLEEKERESLVEALRLNAEGKAALLMDPKTTRFVGTVEEISDEEVISAIKSVPMHY
jgi:hypothetical protein